MNKHKKFEGKVSKLTTQVEKEEQRKEISSVLGPKEKVFKRATFTLTKADIDWLDYMVNKINRDEGVVRQVNKSELVRMGLYLLKKKNPQELV